MKTTKLNFGCGAKRCDGFYNVDIIQDVKRVILKNILTN